MCIQAQKISTIVFASAILLVTSYRVLAQEADKVLTNAKIYTVNDKQPWAEAIAIKDSNVVYVGDNEGAQDFIGDDTQVADMKGRLILPGPQDPVLGRKIFIAQ